MKTKQMIEQVMRQQRFTKKKMCECMCISRPTLDKLLDNPEMFTGKHRTAMSKALKIRQTIIDVMLSGQKEWDKNQVTTIINLINYENNK